MTITACGGTDGANVVLFWPDNLPDDADATLADDPIPLVETLKQDGKLIWFPCEGDGFYSVTIYVRTDVPPDVRAVCRHADDYPAVVVRGDGYFGGAEYMFKRDATMRDRCAGMTGRVRIPAGTYAAAVYRTEPPAALQDTWMRDRVGAGAVRLAKARTVAAAGAVVCGVLAVLGAILMPVLLTLSLLAACVVLGLAAFGLSRTRSYRAVGAATEEFEALYPSYVVHLS
jgi:hypothetical protein